MRRNLISQLSLITIATWLALPTLAAEAQTSAGTRKTIQVDDATFDFRWCPPGEFTMGSTEDFRDEYGEQFVPPHQVRLTQGFWLLETEVTQAHFVTIMNENPSFWRGRGGLHRGSVHPVERVSWLDANEFCAKLSSMSADYDFRLATEAEWEYACRAGNSECRYGPITEIAWVFENTDQGDGSTGHREVATRLANNWGLHDMLGNVSEWCLDWHGPPTLEDSVDPAGPMAGDRHVVRGGNCMADTGELAREGCCLAGARGPIGQPDTAHRLIGFRIVAEASR